MIIFPMSYIILHCCINLLNVSFRNHFSIINIFVEFPTQGSRSSGPSDHIHYAIDLSHAEHRNLYQLITSMQEVDNVHASILE